MGKWREAFEAGVAEAVRKGYLEEEFRYRFSPPATKEDLDEVEKVLGVQLPGDVREMLSEFNGVEQQIDPDYGFEGLYLTTQEMLVHVPKYLRESGNALPPQEQLRKVVFVAQSNGYSALFGVCLEGFGEFRQGEVVMLDHETGEFRNGHPDLMGFVREGCKSN